MATVPAPAKTDPDYSKCGVFGVKGTKLEFVGLTKSQKNDLGCNTLWLELLVPSCSDASVAVAPAPLLVFFNGFSLQFSDYKAITERAVHWGYVVAGYNLPRGHATPSATERDIFPALVEYLHGQGFVKGSDLHGIVDKSSPVVVAGHSRGGKVAGLVFAAYPDLVAAAWLIDPVDSEPILEINSKIKKMFIEFIRKIMGKDGPSAVEAVRKSKKRVGVVGAGISQSALGQSCNPPKCNYLKFYEAAALGSWKLLVREAGHAAFLNSKDIAVNAALDALCGCGKIKRPEAASLAAVPMLYWFEQELRGVRGGDRALPPLFAEWVSEKHGAIEFRVKEEASGQSAAPSGIRGSWKEEKKKEALALAPA